ncbi:MAG: PEP-CTERM sorting domain-containing protein [Planctomycetaceae bacterium]
MSRDHVLSIKEFTKSLGDSYPSLKQIAFLAGVLIFNDAMCYGDVITSLDFSDAGLWSVSLTESNSAENSSSVTGGTLQAAKKAGSGGVRLSVDLIGAISTVGYQNIRLAFQGQSADTLEWNANMTAAVASTDGLRIFGSGVDINANSLNDLTGTAAELDFQNGEFFPTSNFGSDFTFSPSTANSSITNLSFLLQVNADAEKLTLSNVQILGDMIPASVPEPSSIGLIFLGCIGYVSRRFTRIPPEVP